MNNISTDGFFKNQTPEQEPVEARSSIYQNPYFIALCALIGGTISVTAGVGFAFGLPWAAIVLGALLLSVGFVLGFRKDN